MTKKLLLAFLLLGLAVASAKNFTVTLFQPAVVAGTELQPGDYRLTLEGDGKVVLTNGKTSVSSAVKVEQADSKFSATTVRLTAGENGKQKVDQIRLGGTKTRLVFSN